MRRTLAAAVVIAALVALTGCHAFTFGTEADGRYWSHPVTVTNTTEFDFLVRIDLDCAGSPFYGYGITTTVGQAGTSLCHRGAGGEIGVLRTQTGGLLVLPSGGSIDLVMSVTGVEAGSVADRAVPFQVWGMWCGFGCADIVEL